MKYLYILFTLLLLCSSVQAVSAEGGYGLSTPQGVTVDSAGNVSMSDQNGIQMDTQTGSVPTTTVTKSKTSQTTRVPTTTVTKTRTAQTGSVPTTTVAKPRTTPTWTKLTDEGYVSSEIWGAYPFEGLNYIAVDGAGNLYTSDKWAKRIQAFTPEGNYIALWTIKAERGTNDELSYLNNQLSGPEGIAADSAGNVYVVDGENNKIKKFTSDGTLVTEWGSYGEGDGELSGAGAIAVDNAGNVYVAEDGMHVKRISKFSSTGTFLTSWSGPKDNPISSPNGIAVDGAGNVYVLDYLRERVQKYTSDGTFITQWDGTKPGSYDNDFFSPNGIATDSAGNVYVTDFVVNTGPRIQKFTSTGTFVTSWLDARGGRFDGIAVDRIGNIYVAVSGDRGKRVVKYAPPGSISSNVTGNLATTKPITSPSQTIPGSTVKPTATKAAGFGPLEVLGLVIVAVGLIVIKRRH